MHEGKVLHRFAKAHEEGVNGLLKRLGGSRAGMYYVLGKEKLGAEKKSEIAQSYETNVQTIWVPEPKKRDDTLHYEGDPPLNEIDLSVGVKKIDYDELIIMLLTKKKEQIKQLIKDVINEKGSE